MSRLVLASSSATRAEMLRRAGLAFEVDPPRLDEAALKASLRAEGVGPRDQADALAEAKAVSVSRMRAGDFVLGADQILAAEEVVFDKPRDRVEARAQLLALRGRAHVLFTAAVIAREGAPIWRALDAPQLTMRAFSDAFLESYLDEVGAAALHSVGSYQLEGMGAQLFDRVEGDFFSVLGLPLLSILAFLRAHGIAAS